VEDFKLWRQTLQTLYDQRKELMGGLDQMRKRQSVRLKQHWSNADINEDHKLDLKDVEALCRNLNISASEKAIRTNFEVGLESSCCSCQTKLTRHSYSLMVISVRTYIKEAF